MSLKNSAFLAFVGMMLLSAVFFGPSFAMTQVLAPVHMRSVASSLLLLVQIWTSAAGVVRECNRSRYHRVVSFFPDRGNLGRAFQYCYRAQLCNP